MYSKNTNLNYCRILRKTFLFVSTTCQYFFLFFCLLHFRFLLIKVLQERNSLKKKTPILLKISPDETDQVLRDIVDVALHSKVVYRHLIM